MPAVLAAPPSGVRLSSHSASGIMTTIAANHSSADTGMAVFIRRDSDGACARSA